MECECENCMDSGYIAVDCPHCAGSGEGSIPSDTCFMCKGLGEVIIECGDCNEL